MVRTHPTVPAFQGGQISFHHNTQLPGSPSSRTSYLPSPNFTAADGASEQQRIAPRRGAGCDLQYVLAIVFPFIAERTSEQLFRNFP
ncbi:hypothetical protein [Bradyrhizobium sp. JYMT SZCCT0180]|uniref:hypothetical protein n=1 Tax=Bradyrhizobium sp. JYMT SZCCT0180 TaxID=2807666 RepID=UPI001BAA35C5|nr:hypothetical protein [Bradyrhizobium sp. JYMT SZCCT0180]MBR1209046.1 hypothetical protein [Bradyrhizobium sp. JYMT SZCCT0180]